MHVDQEKIDRLKAYAAKQEIAGKDGKAITDRLDFLKAEWERIQKLSEYGLNHNEALRANAIRLEMMLLDLAYALPGTVWDGMEQHHHHFASLANSEVAITYGN